MLVLSVITVNYYYYTERQAGETTNPSDQQPKKLSLYCMLSIEL